MQSNNQTQLYPEKIPIEMTHLEVADDYEPTSHFRQMVERKSSQKKREDELISLFSMSKPAVENYLVSHKLDEQAFHTKRSKKLWEYNQYLESFPRENQVVIPCLSCQKSNLHQLQKIVRPSEYQLAYYLLCIDCGSVCLVEFKTSQRL